MGFPGGSAVKNLPASARDAGDWGLIRVRKIAWRREWQPTPAFLPGKSQGQRSLLGDSLWGHDSELGTTEYTPRSPPLASGARWLLMAAPDLGRGVSSQPPLASDAG